jgi:hypothetical protein
MVPVVEHLPNIHKILSSKKRKKKKKKERERKGFFGQYWGLNSGSHRCALYHLNHSTIPSFF